MRLGRRVVERGKESARSKCCQPRWLIVVVSVASTSVFPVNMFSSPLGDDARTQKPHGTSLPVMEAHGLFQFKHQPCHTQPKHTRAKLWTRLMARVCDTISEERQTRPSNATSRGCGARKASGRRTRPSFARPPSVHAMLTAEKMVFDSTPDRPVRVCLCVFVYEANEKSEKRSHQICHRIKFRRVRHRSKES